MNGRVGILPTALPTVVRLAKSADGDTPSLPFQVMCVVAGRRHAVPPISSNVWWLLEGGTLLPPCEMYNAARASPSSWTTPGYALRLRWFDCAHHRSGQAGQAESAENAERKRANPPSSLSAPRYSAMADPQGRHYYGGISVRRGGLRE